MENKYDLSTIENVLAIDGPAGSGKSTISRLVAKEIGFQYLDTGAMYRAVTWWAIYCGIDLDNQQQVVESAMLMNLVLTPTDNGMKVEINSIDVTELIRTPEITKVIYKIDENPGVREYLVKLQRLFALKYPTIAEGRDMGTVVFPNAKCKIFLDAKPEVRAQRRLKELEKKNIKMDYNQLLREILERDKRNMEREYSPLKMASDAIYVDTSELTIEEVKNRIVQLAKEKFQL